MIKDVPDAGGQQSSGTGTRVRTIDLNSDMGESYGLYKIGADEEVIKYITSANIGCGYHGGDPGTIRRTIAIAKAHGVGVGAHFGYPDLLGFGRRYMEVKPADLKDYVTYQMGAVMAFAKTGGVQLTHVKPHGALYMRSLDDLVTAQAIAEAVAELDPTLLVYTLSGSAMAEAAQAAGLGVVSEFFADRGMQPDGQVKMFGYDVTDVGGGAESIAARTVEVVTNGQVTAMDGSRVPVEARTVCVHSDTPGAARYLRAICEALAAAGVQGRPVAHQVV